MKKTLLFIFVLCLPVLVAAQDISWEDVSSDYEFPEGLRLFHGTITDNDSFFAYYYEVDMNNPDIAIRPYLNANPLQVDDFSEDVGAYGAINGGFFAGTSSVSSVVYPNEVVARNLISLVRNGKTYPVIRSIFALNADRSMSAEWVYHHSYDFDDIYMYDEPMPYECDDPNPLPVPLKEDGTVYDDIAYGLGGGPMLIKDGEITITYCEEIFWGSGVYLTDYRPRTAVGYTEDSKAILFVTNHMKIPNMADILLDLGCYEAMNLDGGGSTAMAAGGESIYDQNRAVPTIMAVVHSDSLHIPQTPLYEKTMDTSDEDVTSEGDWFATANEGYWESPSMLHGLASHEEYYEFPLDLPEAAEYEVYGWWTSHVNRAEDTPFIITHADGVTEVAVDQTISGSMWNHIGTFNFSGSSDETVRVTAGATTNQYVVADGIRIVSYDQVFEDVVISQIEGVDDITVPYGTSKEEALSMLSQHTTITDSANNTHTVDLDWESENYAADVPGDYDAMATFTLPEGVEQTDPPTALEVDAVITVEEDDTSVSGTEDTGIKVYPNPGSGRFTVEGHLNKPHIISISGMKGQMMETISVSGQFNKNINLEGQAPGIYFLRVNGNQINKTLKIIIQ